MSDLYIEIVGGNGTVTVTEIPAINCPGVCSGPIPIIGLGPYPVTATAIPDPGYIFVGWTAAAGFPPTFNFVYSCPSQYLCPQTSASSTQEFVFDNTDVHYRLTAEFALSPCNPITLLDDGPFPIFFNEVIVPITLVPIGGTAPYTFSIDPNWDGCPGGICLGASLPPGLTIGASSGIISGTATSGAPCPYIPILITDSNQCSSVVCIQILGSERPIPPCYYLVPCTGGLTLIVTNDLSLYIGQVIQILDQCFTVILAPNCLGSTTLSNPVITVFPDCCSCSPPKVYTLTDCSLQTPQIITSTDLSQYVDQTIKICDFNATVGVDITPIVGPCPGFENFVTQVTGSTSGFYFDPNGPLVFPYDNPLTFPVIPGQGICVNILNNPADIVSVGTSTVYTVQYFLGTTPLTNPITISPEMDLISAQYFIDQQIIYPNTTITITAFAPILGFVVDVNIQSPVTEQLIAVLTADPSVFIPIPTVTSDFSGSCICYTVTESTSCIPYPAFSGVISGSFPDCECCLPPPPPPPVPPYEPTIPEIDKHTYFIRESQCDIDANKTFANAMYDIFKTEAYGFESCCPRNFNQIWIQKELSDLSKTK